ncbi:MAG: RNA polymerase sigma factor [Flavitalea sp.]
MNSPLLNNEKELLKRIAGGDERAYHDLFIQLWPNVYSAALRLTKSPELAQDLAQEVWLRVWEHRVGLPKVANIYAFMYTITRNLVTDFLRTKVFHDNNIPFLKSHFQHTEADVFGQLEQAEQKESLQEAISKLPGQLGQALTLAYYEGKSHKEIAAIMQITPASSRIYLVRAIALLRKKTFNSSPIYLKLLWMLLIP